MIPSYYRHHYKRYVNGWLIVTLVGAAGILLPILYVMTALLRQSSENWETVRQYLLADYIIGTAKLVSSVGLLATFLGVVLAWLIAAYDFPLRAFFRWALLLPLAIPPYIAAYTYQTMTSYTGVVQATLRNSFDYRLPPGLIEVMSLRGAIFVLTFFLFPYVFMITYSFLARQSASYVENAKLLGHNGFSLFFRVVLPIARPAIISGMMLVVFEVLSDFGVASYFGVQTISTAIFQTWFGLYDVDSAIRLAAWLMVIVVSLFVVERFLRRKRQYAVTTTQQKPLSRQQLKGARGWFAFTLCTVIFCLAFLLPFTQLLIWSSWTFDNVWRADFFDLIQNSIRAALLATVFVLLFSLLAARTVRMLPSTLAYTVSRLMTAGYAIPGAIIAVGVLAVCIQADDWLSPLYEAAGKPADSLVLSMSLAMLIIGYVIRFMATGFNAIEAGYEKTPRSYTEASQLLGQGSLRTFFRVELPLIKGTILTGAVLTFVEVVKELPLTLLLRPFNHETLSTRTYQYAMDERIYEAALPSILLILISMISVLIIYKWEKERA
ncbi:iron ABC transporter permease [Alkalihalobacillus oceani]|uniref:ABC transporter permease n=1 Tax=Halalkalibacter oceani TaxID=1653776 RepID=UPI002041F3FA|nr:iron ABC transporter permease [Halalkalibacter oceani]